MDRLQHLWQPIGKRDKTRCEPASSWIWFFTESASGEQNAREITWDIQWHAKPIPRASIDSNFTFPIGLKASFTSKCIKILLYLTDFFSAVEQKSKSWWKKAVTFFLGYFIAKEHEKMGDRNPPLLGPPRIRKSNFWNHLKMSTFYKKQQWKSLSK